MSTQEALQNLDRAVAQIQATREVHAVLIESVQVLTNQIGEKNSMQDAE